MNTLSILAIISTVVAGGVAFKLHRDSKEKDNTIEELEKKVLIRSQLCKNVMEGYSYLPDVVQNMVDQVGDQTEDLQGLTRDSSEMEKAVEECYKGVKKLNQYIGIIAKFRQDGETQIEVDKQEKFYRDMQDVSSCFDVHLQKMLKVFGSFTNKVSNLSKTSEKILSAAEDMDKNKNTDKAKDITAKYHLVEKED